MAKNTITSKIISRSTKAVSTKVYVPVGLRAHVKTTKTASGTRLVRNNNQ